MSISDSGVTLNDLYELILYLGLCLMFGLGMISGAQI